MKEKIIFTNGLIDLAQPRLGTKIIYKTDDFFASANRIISPTIPVFKEGVFDKHGKWMDGWESRRKRTSGHDYIVLKLGKPGIISKIDVDTSHFNGNQPAMVSIDGAFSNSNKINQLKWSSILPKKKVKANSHHFFSIKNKRIFTHIKFNIFPDGGVARLRLYGSIAKSKKIKNKKINLASLLDGASVIACNNEHFGKAENVLAPGRGINMGDGWETRRRRSPGNDWITIALCKDAQINSLEIDTAFFKGNYPDMCSVQACYIDKNTNFSDEKIYDNWTLILDKEKLFADKIHQFKKELINTDKIFNHIRLNIFPDGGVSRFRVFGNIK